MSAEQKQKVVLERSSATCYGLGYDPGSEPYKRCMALAGVHFTEKLEADQAARRERAAEALARASRDMQAQQAQQAANRPVHCTTMGPMEMRTTTCH
jgi:cysteine synthase